MKPFWVSWYSVGPFTWEGPWWVSGERWAYDKDGNDVSTDTIVAAVMAESAEDAMAKIVAAHDDKTATFEWRFAEERGADWNPFANDRFPRGDWMKWPWPAVAS